MNHDELREKLLRIRRISLDIFISLTALLLILSGVTRILVGDVLLGSAIILGVVGVALCIWHAGKDFRWFRKACVYPITAIHVAPWGYYTEGEPICRLYRSDAPMGGKTFSVCFNILLPPQGSRAEWEKIMTGLDAWMKQQPCAMRLLGRMSANSQIAEVELCVLRQDASPAVLDSLFDCFERTADKTLDDYGRRFIRVEYPDRGHVFYAAFDGFDIGRAIIVAGPHTAWVDLGDSRGGLVLSSDEVTSHEQGDAVAAELNEAAQLYVDDNQIEGIRQSELIAAEEFEKLWQAMPASQGPARTIHAEEFAPER
ncbi:MAG: hypothetical protein IIV56_01710 [Mailhella sp.]|nr:hypothetical protein [Mailhella sp.]